MGYDCTWKGRKKMKTIIIYSSQTGFTKRYAEWLAEELGADIITLSEAKKQKDEYFDAADAIVYGGWIMAGKIVNSEWFKRKISDWKGKRLALFCVGGSPNELSEVDATLRNAMTDEERKYVKTFYCQGGISYENMRLPYKMTMKVFSTMIRNKKDVTPKEKDMAEMLSHSYDISDKKYINPIVQYIRGKSS